MYPMVRPQEGTNPLRSAVIGVIAVSCRCPATLTPRVRTKLTALIAATALLVAVSAAQAAPIPVALYSFASPGDVSAFQSQGEGKCTRKWRDQMMLGVLVGAGTNACVLLSSVVADSSDTAPDQIISATVTSGGAGGPKLLKKEYEGLVLRRNETSGYELRVLPGSQKWQVFRDPKGTAPVALLASGSGKFIRAGTKPNNIVLRAFDYGSAQTSLIATVNGRAVLTTTDSGTDQPDGRRNGITTGAKGTGPGTGLVGVFDDVTVSVANPF